MNVIVELKCSTCATEICVHETGLNQYDVYPCKECFPEYDYKENE